MTRWAYTLAACLVVAGIVGTWLEQCNAPPAPLPDDADEATPDAGGAPALEGAQGAGPPVPAPVASSEAPSSVPEPRAETFVENELSRHFTRWTGTVRYGDGTPIRGPARLEVRRPGNRNHIVVSCSDDGRFDLRLPHARYTLILRKPEGKHTLLEDAEVDGETMERDLVLVGAYVRGTVTRDSTGALMTRPGTQGMWFARAGRDARRGRFIRFGKDGHYGIDGLRPGSYVVRGWPKAVVDTSGRLPTITVTETDTRVDLDITVLDE